MRNMEHYIIHNIMRTLKHKRMNCARQYYILYAYSDKGSYERAGIE